MKVCTKPLPFGAHDNFVTKFQQGDSERRFLVEEFDRRILAAELFNTTGFNVAVLSVPPAIHLSCRSTYLR